MLNRFPFLFLASLICLGVYAHGTGLSSRMQFGKSHYRAGGIRSSLSIADDWDLTGTLSWSKSGDSERSAYLSLGVETSFVQDFLFRFDVHGSRDPGDIHGAGMGAGMDWEFGHLWNEELATTLVLDGGITKFNPPSMTQNELSLGFLRELNGSLELSIFYTQYFYSGDPNLLSQSAEGRKMEIPGVAGLIAGFPRNSFSLGASWDFWKLNHLDGTISSIRSAYYADRTQAASLSYTRDLLSNWNVSIGFMAFKTNGVPGEGALLLGLGYRWQ